MNIRGVPVELRDWFRQHVAWRRAEGDAKASVNQLLLALVHGYAEAVRGERAAAERRVTTRR